MSDTPRTDAAAVSVVYTDGDMLRSVFVVPLIAYLIWGDA
jgi:hypothetical protein